MFADAGAPAFDAERIGDVIIAPAFDLFGPRLQPIFRALEKDSRANESGLQGEWNRWTSCNHRHMICALRGNISTSQLLMKDAKVALGVLLFLAGMSGISQQDQKPTLSPEACRASYVAGIELQKELDSCRATAKEWRDWADVNKPKNDALLNENERLKKEIEENRAPFGDLVIMGVSVGMGLAVVWFAIAFWRKLARTTQRKQLVVLVLSSVWIVVAGIILLSDTTLSKHPINLAVSLFLYSLPAILFGGIALWWFKNAKPDVIKLW